MTYKSLFGSLYGIDTDLGPMFNLTPVTSLFGSLPRGFGKDWYVDSVTGQANRSGKSQSQALATIAQALAKCRANKGDRIICLENHAETLSSATALQMNVAGVTVVGLGLGRNRPTITLDTANTATIAVSADNVRFLNMRFIANFLSIAACFTLTTAKAFRAQGCSFSDTSSILNFLNIIKSTGAANTIDNIHVEDCNWNGLGTTSVNSFILSANDIDGARLFRNHIKLARTATAAILLTVTAGVLTDFLADGNTCISQQTAETGGGTVSVGGSTSTGILRNTIQATLTTATDIIITLTSGIYSENNVKTGVLAAQGFKVPVIDS